MTSNYGYKFTKGIIGILVLVVVVTTPYRLYSEKFEISPYFNGLASVDNAYIEVGPEFAKDNWYIRTLLKFAITDKENSIVQLDRNTSEFASVIEIVRDLHLTTENSPMIRFFRFGLNLGWGVKKYTYFPGGLKENKQAQDKHSLSIELKGVWYSQMTIRDNGKEEKKS